VFTPEELDLDSQVAIKIDGKETNVSFSDLIKGYSTEQSLSNKGRELGDARKLLEEEYNKKFNEIQTVSQASAALLYKEEQELAKRFHEVEKQIEKARDSGDTYEVNELKDKREQAQKAYWNARKNRESVIQAVDKQIQTRSQEQWNAQLKHYEETIPKLIPNYNAKTLESIRDFAIKEGISEQTLDSIADPQIVKFVDDYRRLKEGVSQGVAKRKNTPVKKVPIKKAKTQNQKKLDKEAIIRKKALSENSSPEDQMAFLKGLAERSLSNI
jgi:superfamily II DNA helicase RecQ